MLNLLITHKGVYISKKNPLLHKRGYSKTTSNIRSPYKPQIWPYQIKAVYIHMEVLKSVITLLLCLIVLISPAIVGALVDDDNKYFLLGFIVSIPASIAIFIKSPVKK